MSPPGTVAVSLIVKVAPHWQALQSAAQTSPFVHESAAAGSHVSPPSTTPLPQELGVAVGAGVVVACGVAVTVAVTLAVAVSAGVAVSVGSGVEVASGVAVSVGSGVEVASGVAVSVGVGVGVAIGITTFNEGTQSVVAFVMEIAFSPN